MRRDCCVSVVRSSTPLTLPHSLTTPPACATKYKAGVYQKGRGVVNFLQGGGGLLNNLVNLDNAVDLPHKGKASKEAKRARHDPKEKAGDEGIACVQEEAGRPADLHPPKERNTESEAEIKAVNIEQGKMNSRNRQLHRAKTDRK